MADVDCRVEGRLGRIHLDRPKTLNALTREMIQSASRALADWRDDPQVVAVLVTGEGERAFCAGGDVMEVARLAKEHGVAAAAPFFYDEYRMNWRIKHFPKPYVAVIDGVTMGGGFGISVHGSHRVATERTLFAMPETAIGMFPDVGGTYVLGRMPGGLGLWLALTGTRLRAADTLAAGIATHFVPSDRLDDLIGRLVEVGDGSEVDAAIAAFAVPAEPSETALRRPVIDTVFDRPSVAAIGEAALAEPTGWGVEAWAVVKARSPLSVCVAFAQLRRGRHLNFDDAMRLEFRMVQRVLADHDYFEGVRAVLIDKDQQPRWRPSQLEEVNEAMVAAHFAPLPEGDLALDWS